MAKRPSKGKSAPKNSEVSASKKAAAPRKRAVAAPATDITGVQETAQAGGDSDFTALGVGMSAAIGDLSVTQDALTAVARGEMSDPQAEVLRRLNEITHLIGQIMPLSPETEREFARIFAEKDSKRLGNLVASRAPSETFQSTIEQTSFAVSSLRHELEPGNGFQDTLHLLDAVFKRSAQTIEWWVDILHKVSGNFKVIVGSLTGLIIAITALLTALHFLMH